MIDKFLNNLNFFYFQLLSIGHQKLTVSNSMPLVQNSSYNLPKSGSNNNLVRYEYNEQQSLPNVETKADRNSKCFDDVSSNERRRSKYETELLQQLDLMNNHEEQEVQQQEFKVGEKVTCLKTTISERPVPHKVNIEYRPRDFVSSLPSDVSSRLNDGTDISTLPSEDEQSNGSGSISPR